MLKFSSIYSIRIRSRNRNIFENPSIIEVELTPQALSTEAWSARPYENDNFHGLISCGNLFISFKLAVAWISV